MAKKICNLDDVIDSRDVIDRIEELREERDEYTAAHDTEVVDTWGEAYPDDAAELAILEALAEEASGYASDWRYGETFIRDSYFTDYAMEILEDCGYLPKDMPSWVEIDCDATARNMQQDYTAVAFDGVTYWIRW
jgi:hypothetical protein